MFAGKDYIAMVKLIVNVLGECVLWPTGSQRYC